MARNLGVPPRQSVGGGEFVQNRHLCVPVSTFENHCLEGKLPFGDPFLDSGVPASVRHSSSDLIRYCRRCGKVAEMTSGSDFTHTIVNLSISQLRVAIQKSTEPDQGSFPVPFERAIQIRVLMRQLLLRCRHLQASRPSTYQHEPVNLRVIRRQLLLRCRHLQAWTRFPFSHGSLRARQRPRPLSRCDSDRKLVSILKLGSTKFTAQDDLY